VLALRIQVSPTRIRVPDVCAFLRRPAEQIPQTPPFVCIEVLSHEGRLLQMINKMNDYLHFGVPYVLLLDPETRKAHRWTAEGMYEIKELRTENLEIVIPVADLFEA
jgi:Uma2 family endonuclease